MNTPQQYIDKGFNITPCGNYKDGKYNPKAPRLKGWQTNTASIKDFNGKDNIGIIWDTHFDIDVDNPIAHKFKSLYLKPSSAIYGRKSNPRSHYLYKGSAKDKKFSLPREFEKWCNKFHHGHALIEIRSGSGQQSLGPGSMIGDAPGTGEEVKWDVLEGVSIYDGDVYEDVSKIAFASALTILYPGSGSTRDYCYAVACILAKGTDWTDSEIDRLIEKISEGAGAKTSDRLHVGTHARKQIKVKGRLMGFPTLSDTLGVSIGSIAQIFQWVGVEPPDQNLELIRSKYYYLEDVGEMFDPVQDRTITEKEFNNKWLYDFPGSRGKKKDDKAFHKLLKDTEFQERKLTGRAMLPDKKFPIAVIEPGDHPLLMPGKYYNLYQGRPLDAEEGDVSEIISHFRKVFGDKNWDHLEQYLAFCIRNPGAKTRWIPLVVSVEGVGKGLLMRMMSKLMGYQYVNENVSFKDITEKHSTIIVGSLFVCLNEVVLDKQYATKRTISSQIKPFITDDFLNINEKGKRIYKYLNNCNAIIFSNDKDCLHVDTSSRRYLVIHCKTSAKEVEQMSEAGDFDPLWKKLDEQPEHLLNYFLHTVTIEDEKIYQKRAPKTAELLEMIEDSKHDVIQELDYAWSVKSEPFDENNFRGFISLGMLMNFIRAEWKISHPPRKLVKEWLKTHSIPWKNGEVTRQIVLFNGGKPRVHLLENRRGILQDLTEGQLGQMCSLKSKNHYWEQLELDMIMENNRDETFEQKKDKEKKEQQIWFDNEDMMRRAIYYLKFMDAEVIEDIIQVQTELLKERAKLVKEHSKRIYNREYDAWYEELNYVEFNKIFKPLEIKAHKLIDKAIKARSKAKEKPKEEEIC